MNARILVVDDQPNIVDLLTTMLAFHGFAVGTAGTAAQAVEAAARERPDLILLDVMLPDGSGLDVCRRLRAAGSQAGVVFLTARDARSDEIAGLAYGGDDWITKPFDMDVVLARVRAVLRRVSKDAPRALEAGNLRLDLETLEVRQGDEAVHLSPTELRLLRYLMENPGRVLSRGQIFRAVWECDLEAGSNVVDTYVGYLRRKINPLLIVTHRGFGYAFKVPR